ncbi:hypothetical protein Lepto7376_2890 [[Leptolyngbya] sp. PCC 7376]|nr:hypothetical protein Lepto7376_2890 [[Leptolyngbya] sp. PCC 7376]
MQTSRLGNCYTHDIEGYWVVIGALEADKFTHHSHRKNANNKNLPESFLFVVYHFKQIVASYTNTSTNPFDQNSVFNPYIY